MATHNVLLIGIGPHARKVYVPWLVGQWEPYHTRLTAVVDLKDKQEETLAFLSEENIGVRTVFVNPELDADAIAQLDEIVATENIDAVIISTEPLSHAAYAAWALKKGLSILMDKPITAQKDAAHSAQAARKLATDFEELAELYAQTRKTWPKQCFIVNTQRRYHPGIQHVLDLVSEVSQETGVPVTGIISSHADGQWRLPDELIDIDYHGFSSGYGKGSHSGYHFYDLISQLIKYGTIPEKRPDSVEIFTFPRFIADNLAQITPDDYKHLFDKLPENKYSRQQLLDMSQKFGEIDQFSTFAFKKDGRTITNAQLSLQHTSLSARAWAEANSDLYKGNGRLKHEQHTIQQGPLQSIQIHSYQVQTDFAQEVGEDYAIGGINHFDIHVFRNTKIIGGKAYEKISINKLIDSRYSVDLLTTTIKGNVLCEFFRYLNGNIERSMLKSEITSHGPAANLMSAVYQAQIASKEHKSFIAKISF